MAKKKAKKKAKKSTKKTTTKAKPVTQVSGDPLWSLHAKVQKVMEAVPVVPCSALSSDNDDRYFAYTRAEQIFAIYHKECIALNLKITMYDSDVITTTRPITLEDGTKTEVPCVRCNGKFRITDTDTGQFEEFVGTGDGDNEVWSCQSAETVAMKQALIMYFMTAWPQPNKMADIIKDELAKLPKEALYKQIERILPEPLIRAMNAQDATAALTKFWKLQ